MANIIIGVLVVRIIIWLIPHLKNYLSKIFTSRHESIPFENNYIEVKQFYVKYYKLVPSISFINSLDTAKAFEFINNGYAGQVLNIYQRNYYNWQQSQLEFTATIFKLDNKIMIELGDGYAEILYPGQNFENCNIIIEALSKLKAPEKEQDFEMNIITLNANGLDLKTLNIKPTMLDINLYYNDDFKPIDEIIKERLNKENDKGIILLHGLPGTGKTTYLRYLIGSINKKVLFVSPGVASNLINPEFMDLLLDNPNAVLIIEDAENIIRDRKYSSESSVSNLLNISDGLLSDCLNVQIICTFNSAINVVDTALLRKGRLIAKYEFNKLETTKAQKLSNYLGHNVIINRPMTIAEIANPNELAVSEPSIRVAGFRREADILN
jgi:hypothetical protein